MQAITYILIDLDNTLYPASSAMYAEIDRRMTDYVARLLEVPIGEAALIRRTCRDKFGSTLGGLVAQYDFSDPDDFLDSVHPEDVARFLTRDSGLKTALSALHQPMSVLTNSPQEHALRVLEYLGINECFERIFDIRYNKFMGKPADALYRKVLTAIDRRAQEVLFVDDMPAYLEGFKRIGGRILLVQENVQRGPTPKSMASIANIKELAGYLADSIADSAAESSQTT